MEREVNLNREIEIEKARTHKALGRARCKMLQTLWRHCGDDDASAGTAPLF